VPRAAEYRLLLKYRRQAKPADIKDALMASVKTGLSRMTLQGSDLPRFKYASASKVVEMDEPVAVPSRCPLVFVSRAFVVKPQELKCNAVELDVTVGVCATRARLSPNAQLLQNQSDAASCHQCVYMFSVHCRTAPLLHCTVHGLLCVLRR
jgi:hypothetical protein